MAVKIKCIQCGALSKQGMKFCPNCGSSLDGAEVISDSKNTPKLIGILAVAFVIVAFIVVGVIILVNNMNPTAKYQKLVNNGQIEEANALYSEKIASNEELAKMLAEEEATKIDEIYSAFVDKKTSYEDAKTALERFKKSEASKEKANATQKDIDALNKSRESFDLAVKAESDEDFDTAIANYKLVIETDSDYKTAQSKIDELKQKRRDNFITEAKNYASNSKYSDAISTINKAITKCGSDDELSALLDEYTTAKSEQYVKVECVGKTVTPKNPSRWIFNNYVNNVFEITNNSDKDIKGVEGVLHISDLFGKEIISMGCDFTGQTIKPGETYTEKDLGFECNEFRDDHMKFFNTDYEDLKFSYEVTTIVFGDGTTVKPD